MLCRRVAELEPEREILKRATARQSEHRAAPAVTGEPLPIAAALPHPLPARAALVG